MSVMPMLSPIFVTDYKIRRSGADLRPSFHWELSSIPLIVATGSFDVGVQAAEAVLHEQANAFEISPLIRRFRH
jgi:hypothetical protein